MTIRSTIAAAILFLAPAIASAAPFAEFQVPAIGPTVEADATDKGEIAEGLIASFSRSWRLDNTWETPQPNPAAYDLSYEISLDAFFYASTEATNALFYVSTVEGDYSTAVLTLFSGSFNTSTSGTFGFVESFVIPGQSDYFINMAADQWKGPMDFYLTAEPSAVPLPAALPLLAAGLGGLALVARRRRG